MKRANQFSKPIYITLLLLCLLMIPQAWSQSKSEFSVNASGGFTQWDTNLSEGYLGKERGWGLGLGYGYYMNSQWSLNIEGNYQRYTLRAIFNSLAENYPATDLEGESFEFRYKAEGYKENQELDVIQVPLTLQYQTSGPTKFYVRGGAQIGWVVHGGYHTSIKQLNTSGYYAQYDVELFDPRFMGFGKFNQLNQPKKEMDWDIFYAAVLETGLKTELNDKAHLYIGVFVNYGLHTIQTEEKASSLVEYRSEDPSNFNIHSIFEVNRIQETRLSSFGFKLRYAWGGY